MKPNEKIGISFAVLGFIFMFFAISKGNFLFFIGTGICIIVELMFLSVWGLTTFNNYIDEKKKNEQPGLPQCTCGSWPDPTWTQDDFLRKYEAVKLCPVHKHLKMVMVATPVPVPVYHNSIPAIFDLGEEIRGARIHLINCQQAPTCTKEIYKELDGMVARIESIIQEQKRK